ncbi:MAG: hypothetical protein AB8B37_05275 [Prochlorococcus sp.]
MGFGCYGNSKATEHPQRQRLQTLKGGSVVIKTLLLAAIIALLWSTPQARETKANALRMAANWLDPKGESIKTPKHLQIQIPVPNPLYQGEK